MPLADVVPWPIRSVDRRREVVDKQRLMFGEQVLDVVGERGCPRMRGAARTLPGAVPLRPVMIDRTASAALTWAPSQSLCRTNSFWD